MLQRTHGNTVKLKRKAVSAIRLAYPKECDMEPRFPAERVSLKRIPAQPREAHVVSSKENAPLTIVPVAYETTI